MASRTPLGKRILKNLGKKWLQVIFSVVVLGIALSLSHRLLVKKATTEAAKKKEEASFKFMHCDKCSKEMPYNKDLANKPAMACKCKQGDAGYWTATAESVANGQSPLRFFYTAILVESLVWLISLYYLLARKDSAPQFYFHKCLHCRDMLRYTKAGFDLLVVCPSCGLYIRLPTDEEALTVNDHNDEHTELVMKHFALKLKETGYQFPEERQVAEHEGDDAARSSTGT
jgi:endogenous inhibitor of DNA gyrase (YacG/DUF329 family)